MLVPKSEPKLIKDNTVLTHPHYILYRTVQFVFVFAFFCLVPMFNKGKLSSSEERSLQEFCSQYNVDETACKLSYVEHLEFLDAKAKKRLTERNTFPSNISWKNEKDVEALTNNQLKMYLKQHGLKISGSKAELTERVLSHANGNQLPEMLWKRKNVMTRVKNQNQSQVIRMERTHTLKK